MKKQATTSSDHIQNLAARYGLAEFECGLAWACHSGGRLATAAQQKTVISKRAKRDAAGQALLKAIRAAPVSRVQRQRPHKGNPKNSPIGVERLHELCMSLNTSGPRWYTAAEVALRSLEFNPGIDKLYTQPNKPGRVGSFRSTIQSNMAKRPDLFEQDRSSSPIKYRAIPPHEGKKKPVKTSRGKKKQKTKVDETENQLQSLHKELVVATARRTRTLRLEHGSLPVSRSAPVRPRETLHEMAKASGIRPFEQESRASAAVADLSNRRSGVASGVAPPDAEQDKRINPFWPYGDGRPDRNVR